MSDLKSPNDGKAKGDSGQESKAIRYGVFVPLFVFMAVAVVVGIVNNEALTSVSGAFFAWSLRTFGWLYQYISIIALVVVCVITFSKFGKVRIGGKDAKPKYPFMTWFAMSLITGISIGIILWGVNEPIIYFGNVWGELDTLGVTPQTTAAAVFSMGRCFYNWTFIPYAMYAICGICCAYVYFNKKKKLTVSATLEPLFGEKVSKGAIADVIDTLSTLAIILGLSSGFGAALALVTTGLQLQFGIPKDNILVWVVVGGIITAVFTASSYSGIDKGMKMLAGWNTNIFYALLVFVFITGPIVFIFRTSTAGMATWLQNFWGWGLDPIDIGGEALTMWWTLFDWTVWIAYAPLMGLFLGLISYGRTIREFMIINWIMPSVFGIIWFSVWGGSAIHMQANGVVDLVGAIQENGAPAALWVFLQNLPFGLGVILIPILIGTMMLSFATAADSMTTTISIMCSKNIKFGGEPPVFQKIIWGVLIGSIAVIMAAFGGGAQGVDGIKQLAAAGGFVVLFVFILQIISLVKMLFFDKIEE